MSATKPGVVDAPNPSQPLPTGPLDNTRPELFSRAVLRSMSDVAAIATITPGVADENSRVWGDRGSRAPARVRSARA